MSVELSKLIGAGSYAKIYLAILHLGGSKSTVALKHIEFSRSLGLTSLMEAYITTWIKSRFLVHALKVHLDLGGNFQILQRLALGDAAKLIRRANVTLSGSTLQRYVWQLVCAIATLHSRGLLHCDIKAANILIYGSDVQTGSIRLGDYSISVLIMDAQQGTKDVGKIMGYTATHRPPEVWHGNRYSYPADMWALGCALYELGYSQLLFREQKGYTDQKQAYLQAINTWNHDTPRVSPPISTSRVLKVPSDHNPPLHSIRWNTPEMKDFNNLVLSLLMLEPERRASIWDVLKHPFLDAVRNLDDLPPCLAYPLLSYPSPHITDDEAQAVNKLCSDPQVMELALSLMSRTSTKFPLVTYVDVAHKLLYKVPLPRKNLEITSGLQDEIQLGTLLAYQYLPDGGSSSSDSATPA